jgi:peroxiredoxin
MEANQAVPSISAPANTSLPGGSSIRMALSPCTRESPASPNSIKAKGVDRIICVSVNDAFVMSAWEKAVGVDGKIDVFADGNGEFAKALGLELDASGNGLGIRSKRYAMIIEDGVVKALFVEEVPTQAEASSANAILAVL